jgi:TRAP-type C4-dicarboxylate transport system substrate-binding protein
LQWGKEKEIRMKRRIGAVALAVVATVLAITGCSADPGTGTEDEVHTLRFTYHLPEDSLHSQAMAWWADEVEERSDGRIVIERYYSEGLCPLVEILACLNDGRADVTGMVTGNHPSELPSVSIVGIPFLSTNQGGFALALRALYEENEGFREEWERAGVIPLAFGPSSNAYLGGDFPIGGIDDLEGHSTRGTGYMQYAAEAIGLAPAQVPYAELYDALDRGVLDTWITSLDGVTGISLQEVTRYFVDPRSGMFTGQANPSISIAAYESLGEDLQQIIDEVSSDLVNVYIEDFFIPGVEADCEKVMPHIESFTTFSDADVAEWKEKLGDKAEQAWITDATNAGVDDAEGLLADFKRLIEENEAEFEEVPVVDICNSMKGN